MVVHPASVSKSAGSEFCFNASAAARKCVSFTFVNLRVQFPVPASHCYNDSHHADDEKY